MTSHKNFKRAAGLMLVAVLISRLLGLIREMLIARQFGSTGMVSAYYAAFNLPDLLFFLLSSGALSSAFIPEFTKRFETNKQKEAWQVYSIIFCFMGMVLTLAVVLFWIFAKPLVGILAVPGFVTKHPELVPLTVTLTRIILPCQLFFFIGGLMMATLQSRQEFRATAAAPVIYNIGIIFGAIVLSHWFSIRGLAIGTLIGAFAGNVAYAYYWMRKMGYEFHPSLYLRHPGVVRVGKLALPVIFGLGLPQIDVIVNRWFASFVSASAPADLNFANRLMQVPLGIFAQAAGTAILPMLSAYAAKNAFSEMRSGVSYGLRAIMVESIPSTVFLIIMADPLVRTLYMSGEFRPSSVAPVAILLIWYSVGIFAWAGQRIVAPGFFAMQDTITPVVIGTISTIVFIPLNMILMKTMGASGIAFATTIGISLHFIGMTWYLRKRLKGLDGKSIARTVWRASVAAIVMGIVCFGVRIGMSRAIGSWQLQDGDLKNPSSFAARLAQDHTQLSNYLYSGIQSDTRKMINDDGTATRLTPAFKAMVISELNRIISGPSIYNEERFAKVVLPKDVQQLIDKHPTGRNLVELNRKLIEATYLDSITGHDGKGWLDKILGDSDKTIRSASVDPQLLQEADISDTAGLSIELADPNSLQIAGTDTRPLCGQVSRYIMSRMSSDAVKQIEHFAALSESAAQMPLSLMHDLNGVITGNAIYSPERFKNDKLSPRIIALAEQNPDGKRLASLNRRLLECAYSGEIIKRPIDRVESRLGSLITTLIAMFLGGAVYFSLLKVFKVDEMDYLWNALRRKFFKRRNGAGDQEPPVIPADMGESIE